ncbi:MAG: pentapeptide repeat-containing protein [Xenococcus sp. (in: cyanobacteria)]
MDIAISKEIVQNYINKAKRTRTYSKYKIYFEDLESYDYTYKQNIIQEQDNEEGLCYMISEQAMIFQKIYQAVVNQLYKAICEKDSRYEKGVNQLATSSTILITLIAKNLTSSLNINSIIVSAVCAHALLLIASCGIGAFCDSRENFINNTHRLGNNIIFDEAELVMNEKLIKLEKKKKQLETNKKLAQDIQALIDKLKETHLNDKNKILNNLIQCIKNNSELSKRILENPDISELKSLLNSSATNSVISALKNYQVKSYLTQNINNYGAKITKLISVDLSEVDLSYASLCSANLRNSNLRNTNLSCANLRNTNLKNVDLSYANLMNADLSNADLSNANLTNANLNKTKVQGALFANNLGISESLKNDLITRGAILKDLD